MGVNYPAGVCVGAVNNATIKSTRIMNLFEPLAKDKERCEKGARWLAIGTSIGLVMYCAPCERDEKFLSFWKSFGFADGWG